MKRSVILLVAFGCILAPASRSLLAQKGHGNIGTSGLGATLPPVTGKSKASTREGAEAPSAGSASNPNSANVNVGSRLASNTALSARIQPRSLLAPRSRPLRLAFATRVSSSPHSMYREIWAFSLTS
jgi:hypothetical protein